MKLSLLITTYNTEKYIGKAIESFVCQKLPFDWELLIGDDGSTDRTVEFVNEWVNQYPNNIKLYVHDRVQSGKVGSRAAKNRAFLLEHASGEYIHFLDGDDCFIGLDTIKSQVDILDNPLFSDCSCCAQNIIEFNVHTQKKSLLIKEGIGDKIYDIRQYWSYYYFHTDTLLFRHTCKELLLKHLYRDYLNDNFITYLVLQFGKIYYQDRVGAQYNQTGDGLWTGHSRIYGSFRNLQLYDLELAVRQDIKELCLKKHNGDIRRIKKEYKVDMIEDVRPLMEGLDPQVFKSSLLLFKLKPLSLGERFKKLCLFIKADYIHYKYLYLHRLKKYILRNV